MKRRRLFHQTQRSEEVNLSPLMDVVFILLIFFIVTSTFAKDRQVGIQRPRSLSASPLQNQSLQITIRENGQIFHGEREIGLRGVRSLVRRNLSGQERPVLIIVDRHADIEQYIEVHDEAAFAGASSIAMATHPK